MSCLFAATRQRKSHTMSWADRKRWGFAVNNHEMLISCSDIEMSDMQGSKTYNPENGSFNLSYTPSPDLLSSISPPLFFP